MILVDPSLYKRKRQVELVPPRKVNFCRVSGIDLIQGQLGNLIRHCQRCNVNLTMFFGGPVILLRRITSETRPARNLVKLLPLEVGY